MPKQEILNVTETAHPEEYLQFTANETCSSTQRMVSLLDELENEVHLMQHPRTSIVTDLILFLRKQISYLQYNNHHQFNTDRQASSGHDHEVNRYWDYP